MTSNWDRQQNPRARAKKDRAKQGAHQYGMGTITSQRGMVLGTQVNHYLVKSNKAINSYTKDPELLRPAVGDVVYLQGNQIVGIMERRTFLARFRGDTSRHHGLREEQILAANIDVGIIVASLTHPSFHARFVDRFLMLCQDGGVKPVLCITKTDLTSERPAILLEYKKMGIPIIETSVVAEKGIDSLKEVIAGQVAVFLGASGVGKSSLINAFFGEEITEVGEVGNKTERGRHTTTASHSYEWMADSYIIDTPGIRALSVAHIPQQEIASYFSDFEPYTHDCKYRDCLHVDESDCGVKKAVETGCISKGRYESYVRLIEDGAY